MIDKSKNREKPHFTKVDDRIYLNKDIYIFLFSQHYLSNIKYLEKVPDSDPPKVRVISANAIYDPADRLLDEIGLVGRVVWFGRRVQ